MALWTSSLMNCPPEGPKAIKQSERDWKLAKRKDKTPGRNRTEQNRSDRKGEWQFIHLLVGTRRATPLTQIHADSPRPAQPIHPSIHPSTSSTIHIHNHNHIHSLCGRLGKKCIIYVRLPLVLDRKSAIWHHDMASIRVPGPELT